jgi:hypothetical protein
MWVGVAIAAGALTILTLLDLSQREVLDQIERPLARSAADAFWDITLRGLITQTRTQLALGVVLALAMVAIGPSRGARWVRDKVRGGATSVGERTEGRPDALTNLGRLVGPNRTAFHTAGVVGALIIFVTWDRPTAKVVLLMVALIVVWSIAVEVVASFNPDKPGPESEDDGAADENAESTSV